ncbi:MAG: hypothetical protein KBD37_05115 [Burkholderiales bacterium]|nr:hypothetical protein [Burkholderiales bacterium]
MRILIVKYGALGDVVRTSYFARSIKEKYNYDVDIWWLTTAMSCPLIRFNPYIDHIVLDTQLVVKEKFDIIYSLDDEATILNDIRNIATNRLVGAYLNDQNKQCYTEDSAIWFDMGLISRYGRIEADVRKKLNKLGHAEIFKKIFEVDKVYPEFFNSEIIGQHKNVKITKSLGNGFVVGINPFAGVRWKSKAINEKTVFDLIDYFLQNQINEQKVYLNLIGAGADFDKNIEIWHKFGCNPRILVPDTRDSVFKLAAVIKNLNLLVSTDSLALHLALSQKVPSVGIFTATSAAEIDSFGLLAKVLSTAPDYCSYKPEADNTAIHLSHIVTEVKNYFASSFVTT